MTAPMVDPRPRRRACPRSPSRDLSPAGARHVNEERSAWEQVFFKDGEVVDTVVGAVPRAEIAKRVESLR